MKSLPDEKLQELDPMVQRIWEDIVYSMDQYTHDSVTPKFYLPEQLITHARSTAAIFASYHYMPLLTEKEAYKSRLFSLFLLSINCGIQIFLKERSIMTDYSPYSIETNMDTIKQAKQKVTRLIFEGVEILVTTDQVMNLVLEHINSPKIIRRLTLNNKELNTEKFEMFLPGSMLWGYLFADEIIID
ncbi:MAG: hypothetical protein HY430_03365 [Candidatus Levybacteria bacterium]|nr:hypothetical protein [Candidatus Levybacteria bacterium]